MLGDKRLLRTIRLKNLLSFGPDSEEIELKSLNVLVGPNGTGKSNLIEAIDLLRATAGDLTAPVRAGGGVAEWLWKGTSNPPDAEIEVTVYYPDGFMPLRHTFSFSTIGQRFELLDESVENEHPEFPTAEDVRFYYRYQRGRPVLNVRTFGSDNAENGHARMDRRLQRQDLAPDQSVLSQRKDPDQYPEITYLGNCYNRIRLYREWDLGRHTPARLPQKVDLPNDFLLEDASNLGLVLNDLTHRGEVKTELFERIKQFYASFRDLTTYLQGSTIQVFFHEQNLQQPIPATRLSDGTLRFLCLASVLCHPTPPPLICIEEPEIGLHPDILPIIAELLVEASHRTQLIVTTHSDILIDALTDTPDAVLVCEKDRGVTSIRRLDKDALQAWLAEYSLGDLWRSGELGGNRW